MEQSTKALKSISSVTKAYLRISSIKTALSVFLVGYTALKLLQIFKEQ